MLVSKLPRLTIALGIFIIISATFARQVSDFIKAHIGEKGFLILVGIIFVIFGLSFLVFVIRKRPKLINILLFNILLILGMFLAWQIKIPVEKMHILEYAVLGWVAGLDLVKRDKNIKSIVFASMICITLGILDELFQKMLPYRYFDLRDIVFNSLGGAWGVILYLLI